ncbi:hypothetical protein [Streptacidiphilus albus]|uniref:hypothetical protein n=1 Tax=Streptacidiphilus albus TaxID=105425 RepID=UPI00054B4373|nr:hypothetical protein [Streptacidiphilus albus]
MNRDLFAFLTANTASGRFVTPSQALALDSSLDRLTGQNRALQEQLATDREVMARALKQQERDQAVHGSIIKEAQRQDRRANLLATALDDVLRTFTDAKPDAWYGKQLRSWYVKEQQLDDWRALLPASKNRSGWRTDLMARSQYDREVQKARDSADYAQKRSNHLVDVGEQHATELLLRAQAEQQLRAVTAERDQLAARLRDIQPERERSAEALGRAYRRAQAAGEERERAERRAESTIAEARRQAVRADAAEARAEAAEAQRQPSPTSIPLIEHLTQFSQTHQRIAGLEAELFQARRELAARRPLDESWPHAPQHVHPAPEPQVSTPPLVDQPDALRRGVVRFPDLSPLCNTPFPAFDLVRNGERPVITQRAPRAGDRVQLTYEAELVAQVDTWGRRRVRWSDGEQQVPAYVRVGSLPAHATVTVLDGGR